MCPASLVPYMMFVADIVRGEGRFFCHMEKFQLWANFRYEEVLDVDVEKLFDFMS